jgi:DHA3 family macrolide efflux protein-like MFS transporter
MANLAAFVPIVVLGPFMGVIVDRWSRRWIMALADGAVALLTLVLALLFWLGAIQVWHVYLLLFLRAVGEGLHEPAMAASTTMLVPKEHLTRVASANQTRQSLTFLAGPVLGALLMEVWPIQGVLAIDVATALPAIVPLLFLDVPQPAVSPEQAAVRGWQAVVRDTGEGLRYIWGWRGLFVIFCTISLVVFFQRPAVSMLPLLVTDVFGGGPIEMGWLSAAWQTSAVLSGIVLSAWGGSRRKIVSMLVALLLYALANLARGLTPADAFWLVVATSAVGGLASPLFFASLRAMLQSTVPPEVQGRVFATQNSLTMGMGPLGLVILGPLADLVGVQPLFVMTGLSALLVAGVWALTPSVRRVEQGPQGTWDPSGRSRTAPARE